MQTTNATTGGVYECYYGDFVQTSSPHAIGIKTGALLQL